MKVIIQMLILALMVSAVPALQASPIQPGQAIEITLKGVPPAEQGRISGAYSVSEGGYVSLWQIGSVKAAGIDSSTLARNIEAAYLKAEIYTNPTINVMADSSDKMVEQLLTVGGKVRAPGPKPFQRGMTLYQAVMAAGGPTEFGALNRVSLYRNGKRYLYDLTKGEHKLLKVYPNDTIEVPEKNWIGR